LFTKKQLIRTAVTTFVITAFVAVLGTYFYVRLSSYDVLTEAKRLIIENYVDPLSDEQIEKMNDYALHAMVASLEDPYSYYFDEETFETFEEDAKEEYVGIGVTFSFDTKREAMVVIAATDGSPAQKAGILPEDVIIKVDDIAITKDTYQSAVDRIRGENAKKGSAVTLGVLRGETELTFEIARDFIPITTVSYKMQDKNIGYIRIAEFRHSTTEEFSNALSSLQQDNAKALIIDLRSNPGGYAESVLQMTDMLLPKGTIAYLENNKGEKKFFYSDNNSIALPMAILVNEGTASAAELMAGSTQAHGKAKIIGTKTYGKAVGQLPIMLTEETAIYLTDSRFFTPKGICIDKKGIVPDITVDLPDDLKARLSSLTLDEDVQLRTAMETLYDTIDNQNP